MDGGWIVQRVGVKGVLTRSSAAATRKKCSFTPAVASWGVVFILAQLQHQ